MASELVISAAEITLGIVQIRVDTGRRAYAYRFIGKTNMQAISISSRINSNSINTHLFACPDYSQRYLSPVGYEYLFKHF